MGPGDLVPRHPGELVHALVGGIIGAAATGSGFAVIQAHGLWKVAIALIVSPLLGFVMALAIMQATLWWLRDATPRANVTLSRVQILTSTALALSHGANDAQKTMGVIAMGLLTLGSRRCSWFRGGSSC